MQPPAALPVLLLLVAAARPGAGLAPAAMSFEPEAADPLPTSSDSSSTSSSSAAAPFARPAADPPRAAAPPLPYRARPPSTAPPPPPPSPPDALLGALPNFAGQLCFSSRSACAAATVCGPLGVDCSTSLASLFTSCTSGPANLATNWVCDVPNAEFGATASASGLLCYSDPLACDADPLNRCGGGANADATPCAPAPGWCSSGLALGFAGLDGGSSQQQWACAASLPAGAAPQGSGLPCYATQAACEAVGADAGCSPLGTPPAASGSGSTHSLYDAATGAPEALRCVKDVAFCAGGEAVVSSSFWTCPTSYQTGAAVNSAGVLCFADEASCTMSGTNACLAPPAAGCAPANASGGACATVGHPWTCLPAAFAAASGGGGSGGDDDAGAKGVVGVPTPRPSVSLPSPPSPPPGGAGYVAAAALSVVLSVACVGGVLAVALRRDAAAAPRRLRGF